MFTRKWNTSQEIAAQELIRRESLTHCWGRCWSWCSLCCYKRTNVISLYIISTFTGVIAVILLIVFGVALVKPYFDALGYTLTTCTTFRKEFLNDIICSCGKRCSSSYPCLHVFVTYQTLDGTVEEALLKDSEYADKCTIEPRCSVSRFSNRARVNEFVRDYGTVGRTFSCRYGHGGRVIRTMYSNSERSMHLLLWPALLVAANMFLFCTAYLVCGCRYVCILDPPSEVKRLARLAESGVNVEMIE